MKIAATLYFALVTIPLIIILMGFGGLEAPLDVFIKLDWSIPLHDGIRDILLSVWFTLSIYVPSGYIMFLVCRFTIQFITKNHSWDNSK